MFFLLSTNRLNIRNFYCVTVNVNCLVYAFQFFAGPRYDTGIFPIYLNTASPPRLGWLAGVGKVGLYIYFGLRALFGKVQEALVDLEKLSFHVSPGRSSKLYTKLSQIHFIIWDVLYFLDLQYCFV